MTSKTCWKIPLVSSLLAVLAALPGCGQSSSKPQAPLVRGVFTSTADCANLGMLTFEQCSNAISSAVSTHESTAPSYPNLKICEKEVGPDKCEHTSEKIYRPRLMAFVVAMSNPPQAAPLYPTMKGEAGFRTASNNVLSSEDESLTFSLQARSAAETYAGKSSSGGGMFGN